MKVLHVMDALNCGGAQRALTTLLPHLSGTPDQEHSVAALFAHRRFDWSFPPGVTVTYLASSYPALPVLPHRLRAHLAQCRPDIIHVHLFGGRFVVAAALVGRRTRPKVIWHEHSGDALRER